MQVCEEYALDRAVPHPSIANDINPVDGGRQADFDDEFFDAYETASVMSAASSLVDLHASAGPRHHQDMLLQQLEGINRQMAATNKVLQSMEKTLVSMNGNMQRQLTNSSGWAAPMVAVYLTGAIAAAALAYGRISFRF